MYIRKRITEYLSSSSRHFKTSNLPKLDSQRRLLLEPLEERRLMATIDLATLTSAQGSILYGASALDYSGRSVSRAGDVNGDGFDDVFVGAYRGDGAGDSRPNSGESYVVFGSPSLSATIDLASLGSAGLTIYGVDGVDVSGKSVSAAGDVNGDGFDDLIIGANFAYSSGNSRMRAGESYVIYGGGALPATIDLASLGTKGVTIFGADIDDRSGTSVSGAGDVNGDGFDDLIIGSSFGDGPTNNRSNAGDSYLVFGGASLPSTIDLASLGAAGTTLFGVDIADESGYSVSSAGDMNGDGFDDLVIGARFADAFNNQKNRAGDSYVVFGKADWSATRTIDLASLGSTGITIFGANPEDKSGTSVHSAGDVNGDGFDDLLIGAYTADPFGKSDAGTSYVVFGSVVLPTTIDLNTLGSAGMAIFGVRNEDRSGRSVSNAGDVNADGFDDLLIGAFQANAAGNSKPDAGESYVILGSGTLPTTVDLTNLGTTAGITIFGVDIVDESGVAVSGAGDVNGDGFDDLIIGAFQGDGPTNNLNNSGESYIVYGSDVTNTITHPGTAAGETLTGTAASNIINGSRGDDIVIGNGGADVLTGGQGNDVLAISDLAFKRIIGGTGSDTLRLDGGGLLLNLPSLRDNRILDIEAIDIAGSGNNTLTLNQREVLNLSGFKNTLVVRRDANDAVNFGNGWIRGINEAIGADTFEVYTQGAATLKIQRTLNAPPKVESIVFSDGTAQRSRVTSIRVNFDADVTIDSNAFSLEASSIDGGAFAPVTFTVNQAVSNVAGKTVATLTFSGASVVGGSIPDGNYRVTALSSKIRSTVGSIALDGDSNELSGGDFVDGESETDNFFRMFGDSDGNGGITPADTSRFRATIGTSVGDPAFNAVFDFDGNGGITPADTSQFRLRIGKSRMF